MTNKFTKAKRSKTFLKIAVTGPSGSGKTYSSLRLARGFVGDSGRIALIDTENGSASNYDTLTDFDVLNIEPPFEQTKYISAINAAVAAKYDALIIDSASHLWKWVLEYKSKLDKHAPKGSYTNWNEAGQKLEEAINAVLQSPIHIIFCMRSKMEYVLEQNEKGKQVPTKVGMSPIMRDGIEYEFTTVFDIGIEGHLAKASKDRTGQFTDKVELITEETGRQLRGWHDNAEDAPNDTGQENWVYVQNKIDEMMTINRKDPQATEDSVCAYFKVHSLKHVTREQIDNAVEMTKKKYQTV